MQNKSILCLAVMIALASSRLVLPNEHLDSESHPISTVDHPKINNMTPEEVLEKTKVHDLFPGVEAYSGYVDVIEKTGSSIYFLFMQAMDVDPSEAPLILWLQGGPGCSGFAGNFQEFGPFELVETGSGDYRLIPRRVTWNDKYNILYVDQPFGTGFSYAAAQEDYVTDEKEMSQDLYKTLQVFFQKFPTFQRNDFFIAGESYAGHYIPNITHFILQKNEEQNLKNGDSDEIKLNLKGISIGDGAVDIDYQSQTFSSFGLANGLVDYKQYLEVVKYETEFAETLKEGHILRANTIWNRALNKVVNSAGGINIYNFRVFGSYPDFNDPFLNQEEVKEKLHVPAFVKFTSCDSEAFNKLQYDLPKSYSYLFPAILAKIPVLLYNGQNDLVCNAMGSEAWIRNIDWPHKDEYNDADRKIWKNTHGEIAGYTRKVDKLMQAVVIDAGHMVPMDQPFNAHELLDNFVSFAKEQDQNQGAEEEILF